MKIKALAIVAVLVSGCMGGDGDGADPGPVWTDPLKGTSWAAPITGYTCEMGFKFGQANDYLFLYACVLESGQTAVSAERGVYSLTADTLYMTARESSCPREVVTVSSSATYHVSGNTLSLTGGSALVNFSRIATSTDPMAGVVAIGCFDDQLYFTPRPITAL